MLDAGQYIKLAWDTISDATIKNAFNNAKLVTLKGGAHEEIDMMADLLCSLKALNILIDESTLDKFVHVDDKNSEDFSYEMWNDVSELLKSMQATNNNEDENESCTHAKHRQETMSLFVGLNTYTIKFLKSRISFVSWCASLSRKLL